MFLTSLLLITTLWSCEKKEEVSVIADSIDDTYEYSKMLTISDADGNTANIRVQARSQEVLDVQTKDIFELKTSTKDWTQVSSTVLSPMEPSVVESDFEQADVLVEITDYEFNEEVTSFSVESSLDKGNASAARWVDFHYEYGANDVRGIIVTFTGSVCNQSLKVKLSKKSSSNNWFWQFLGSGKLRNIGDQWAYAGPAKYAEYRLRVEGSCIATYNRNWLIIP